MFLHLGSNLSISTKEIIAILDIGSTNGKDTHSFLQIAKDEGFIVEAAGTEAKSFVITDKKIFLSPIASLTLRKRFELLANLDEEYE